MIKNKNFCALFSGTISSDDCKQLDLYISGLNLKGGIHSMNVYECISVKTGKPYTLAKISFDNEMNEDALKEAVQEGKANGLITKNVVDAQQIRNIEAFMASQKNNKLVYQRD